MVGELVKKAIKMSGKTQEEVAEGIGVSREYLGRLLKGVVPEIYVDKIKIFGIDLSNVNISEQNKPVPYYDVDASAGNVTGQPKHIKKCLSI